MVDRAIRVIVGYEDGERRAESGQGLRARMLGTPLGEEINALAQGDLEGEKGGATHRVREGFVAVVM